MNFYNPYYFAYPSLAPKTGIFKSLFKNFNFASILTGTQKTLNTVNQIIPIVKEARPMMENAKTMFHLMSEFNRNDETKKKESKKTTSEEIVSSNVINEGPTFFQ